VVRLDPLLCVFPTLESLATQVLILITILIGFWTGGAPSRSVLRQQLALVAPIS
jgi:hypothetical protein